MVKLLTYCVLLSSLLLGCSAGIVDPAQIEPTDASGYFWPSSIDSASYSQKDILSGKKTPFTLNFDRDNPSYVQVLDNYGNRQFAYRVTDEGIYLDNLTRLNPFIPLPEGFTLDTIATTYTTTSREMKKVLVINEKILFAVDNGDTLFSTMDGGINWSKVNWEFGPISTWMFNRVTETIYIGTHDGEICASPNKGLTWRVVVSGGRNAITALAPADSLNSIFYAAGDSVLGALNYDNYKDSVINVAKDHLGKGVTALAITGSLQDGYSLSAVTDNEGIWTATVYGQVSQWKPVTPSWKKCYGLAAINGQTLYSLGSNGGEVKLITSSIRGLNWSAANTASFVGGTRFLASSGKVLMTVTGNGISTRIGASNLSERANVLGITATEVNDLSGGDGIFAVATDTGIFISTAIGDKWENISSGPLVEETREDVHVKGSLLLLQEGENSLDPGSIWDAGKCHGVIAGATSTYFITAKVSEAINELSLGSFSGNTYTDVLPVQYIFSKAANSTNVGVDTYRLIIYYAKGVGPVYMQNYLGQVLLSEMYRN